MTQATCVFILPSYHKSCGTRLEERAIDISGEYLNNHSVDYCPKCELYMFKGIESNNPKEVGEYIDRIMALNPANKKIRKL